MINKMGLEGEVHDFRSLSNESEFYPVDSGSRSFKFILLLNYSDLELI